MLHHIRWPRAQQPTAGAAALGLQRAQVMPEFFQVPFQEVGDTNATWLENCDWKYQNIVILGYYYIYILPANDLGLWEHTLV